MKLICSFMDERFIKNRELNRILDKFSSKGNLSNNEREFIEHYSDLKEIDMQDYSHLSSNIIKSKIANLMESNHLVICNLHDRDGLIGERIVSINDDIIQTKNSKIKLKDNVLYNLIYNLECNYYSIEVQDEYYEKLYVNND